MKGRDIQSYTRKNTQKSPLNNKNSTQCKIQMHPYPCIYIAIYLYLDTIKEKIIIKVCSFHHMPLYQWTPQSIVLLCVKQHLFKISSLFPFIECIKAIHIYINSGQCEQYLWAERKYSSLGKPKIDNQGRYCIRKIFHRRKKR